MRRQGRPTLHAERLRPGLRRRGLVQRNATAARRDAARESLRHCGHAQARASSEPSRATDRRPRRYRKRHGEQRVLGVLGSTHAPAEISSEKRMQASTCMHIVSQCICRRWSAAFACTRPLLCDPFEVSAVHSSQRSRSVGTTGPCRSAPRRNHKRCIGPHQSAERKSHSSTQNRKRLRSLNVPQT